MLPKMILQASIYYNICASREWDPLPDKQEVEEDEDNHLEEEDSEERADDNSAVQYPTVLMSPPGSESGYESNQSKYGATCHICKKVFTRPDDRDRHIRERHKKEGKVTCEFCGALLTKRLLLRHLKNTRKCLRRRELKMIV